MKIHQHNAGHMTKKSGSQGELIVYPCSGVRCDRRQFQTSSTLKPRGQSKPNLMWILLGKGEQKFV